MVVCNCYMFCCTLLYFHSSIAIILMGKRELVALLNLSSWCLVMVERLFLAVPRGFMQFVIVVFPVHTHLLFYMRLSRKYSVMLKTQHRAPWSIIFNHSGMFPGVYLVISRAIYSVMLKTQRRAHWSIIFNHSGMFPGVYLVISRAIYIVSCSRHNAGHTGQ